MARITTIRKYVLKTAGIVLAVLLLVVIAAWVFFATLDLESQRARIEKLASQVLARDVHIDGPMHLSGSVFPRVSIEKARIANPDWATHPDFLVVDRLEVQISLLSLLRDRFVIRDIELTGASVHLQRGRDKTATWIFKSGPKRESLSGAMPDIVALHAKNVSILYYPLDRPPVVISIDELQGSLVRHEPVVLRIKGGVRDFPLSIELHGGTLAALFDPVKRWPFEASLDTDIGMIDFEGYIEDPLTLNGIDLIIASDKQKPHKSLLSRRSDVRLVERYQAHLSMNRDAETYMASLAGEFYGFDLSQLYEQPRQQMKSSMKFQEFKINAQGSGKLIGELLKTATVDMTGSGIEFRSPMKDPDRKFYLARVDSLRANSKRDGRFELLARGTANRMPVQFRASLKNILYALWQGQDVPLDMDIQTKAASAHFAGRMMKPLKEFSLAGQISAKADDLETIGALVGRKWPKSAALGATSPVKFSDRTLAFPGVRGRLGSQTIGGEFTLRFDNGINLSLKAHTDRFNIHDVMPATRVPDSLVFDMNDLNLSIQGKGDSFKQSVLGGVWQITARKGRAGWQSKSGAGEYVFALNDIRFDTHDQEPVTLAAQGLHNELQFKLNAQAGRLEELLDTVQPYPLNLHVTGSGLSASLQGTVKKPLADIAFVGDLNAKGQLPVIGQIIHVPLTHEESADLRAQFAMSRGDLRLSDVVARTDGTVVNGDLFYQAGKLPKLTINSSGSINLAPYLEKQAKPDQNTSKNRARRDRVVPELALDFGKQSKLAVVVTIKDLSIKHNESPITVVNARFTAGNGVLRLDPLEFRSVLNDSSVLSRIEVNSSGQPSRARLELEARNIDFGEILKKMKVTNEVAGTLNLNMNVNGQGKTLRDVIGSANGQLQIVADKGSIPKWALEIWGADLVRLIIPMTWLEDPLSDLNCAVGRFNWEDGVMRSQTLLADTKRVTVAGELLINWQNEQVDGLFKPQPKDPTLFHLGTPIRLSGTLAQPKTASAESGMFRLGKWAIGLSNPATLIVLFGDVGAKEKNPCAALLKTPAHD
ncbi:MAG: AsmA family protein [Sulfuricaulis sp.]|uniref:AsmA family protein n=1 Tax=Sulfuricaulis sp. TaxID=2003553 RepID=UPI003C40E582